MSQSRVIRRRRGFTLIEVLMVIVILGILVAVVGRNLMGTGERARVDVATTLVKTGLKGSLDLFQVHMATYPTELTELVERPSDEEEARKWAGPYLKAEELKDPWGQEYYYKYPGENNETGYDLGSNGPDKQWGSDDDIKNW
jgi:general secretion pathway protein G